MTARTGGGRIGGLFSPMLERALRLAARGHAGQFRKGRGEDCGGSGPPLPEGCIPYITHVVGTALILDRLGMPEEVVVAGLLHDYLEDVPDPEGPAQLERRFGSAVLELVLAVTENKRRGEDAAATWRERKEDQLARLDTAPAAAVTIKGADALHNARSLLLDLQASSDHSLVWERFNAGPEDQLWYLSSVAGLVRRRLAPDHPLALALEAAARDLAAAVGDSAAKR